MRKADVLKPTDAELEILQILWKNGSSTVRFVNDQLNMRKKVGVKNYWKDLTVNFTSKAPVPA